MDSISLNGLDFRKSRSGRLLIPRLRTWTGERVTVSKRGCVEVLEGKPDYTSTFQSERSVLKEASSLNLSESLLKNPEITQRKLTKSCSGYESAKLMQQKNIRKVEAGKILEVNNNAGQRKTASKRSTRISGKCLSSTVSSCKKMSPSIIKNQTKEIVVTKARTPSPRKTLRKQRFQQDEEIDIFGPEFQPVVRLVRLLPEEILSLTEKKPEKLVDSLKKSCEDVKRKKDSNVRKNKGQEVQPNPLNTDLCRKSSKRSRPRTVRETQKLLSVLNRSKDCEEFEDEAASTAAFFKNSPSRTAINLLNAVELLNDDFESDDNLSIRTLSERESSPISSGVSPIGSLHETDAETSGREDVLLGGSPILGNASEFQRARFLHRTIKDRTKLLKKAQQQSRYQKEDVSLESLSIVGTSTPSSSQLLKPRMIRALEKDLKEKAKSSKEQWDFSTYFRGNLLHILVNSDSDSESSTVDPLDEF